LILLGCTCSETPIGRQSRTRWGCEGSCSTKNGSPYFESYRLAGEEFIGSLQLTRVEPARNDRIAPGVEVEIKKGPFASRRGVSLPAMATARPIGAVAPRLAAVAVVVCDPATVTARFKSREVGGR